MANIRPWLSTLGFDDDNCLTINGNTIKIDFDNGKVKNNGGRTSPFVTTGASTEAKLNFFLKLIELRKLYELLVSVRRAIQRKCE